MAPPKIKMRLIDEDAKIEDMYLLSKAEIQQRLSDADIAYEPTHKKHELQALWALQNLGLLTLDEDEDEDEEEEMEGEDDELMRLTAVWCKMLVRDQLEELKEKGLSVEGTKWDHIKTLLFAQLEEWEKKHTLQDETEKLKELAVTAQRKPALPEIDIAAPAFPDIAVIDLLLSAIELDVRRNKSTVLLPGCPGGDYQALINAINCIPKIQSLEKLKEWFNTAGKCFDTQKLDVKPREVLSWLCLTLGGDIVPARGNMRLENMPDSVHQFVLVKPTATLEERFQKEMAHHSSSCVLFHGTGMSALRSIICNGFYPARDQRFGRGLFTSEHPGVASMYARADESPDRCWKNSPYKTHGIILGCEAAGSGRHIPQDSEHPRVHVITKLSSIIVRYIFLVKPAGLVKSNGFYSRPSQKRPEDKALREEMLKAFDLFRQIKK